MHMDVLDMGSRLHIVENSWAELHVLYSTLLCGGSGKANHTGTGYTVYPTGLG